jgi:hypothetical protein
MEGVTSEESDSIMVGTYPRGVYNLAQRIQYHVGHILSDVAVVPDTVCDGAPTSRKLCFQSIPYPVRTFNPIAHTTLEFPFSLCYNTASDAEILGMQQPNEVRDVVWLGLTVGVVSGVTEHVHEASGACVR